MQGLLRKNFGFLLHINSRNQGTWRLVCVYAMPYPAEKEFFWRHMTHLIEAEDAPWFLLGDSNAVLFWRKNRLGGIVLLRHITVVNFAK